MQQQAIAQGGQLAMGTHQRFGGGTLLEHLLQ